MSDGYVYAIERTGPDYTFRYSVTIERYEQGRRIHVGSDLSSTKWGARWSARNIKRKDQKLRALGTRLVERGEL